MADPSDNRSVSVGAATRISTLPDHPRHTSADFPRSFLTLELTHQSVDHQIDSLRLALVYRHQLDAEEVEALENKQTVGCVAGKAIKSLGQYDIELATLSCGEQVMHLSTVQRRPGHCPIFVMPDDLVAVTGGICRAQGDLIFNRAIVLQVRAVAAIDHGSHD